MPTITSLHIEIARLRHENERLRAQLDALLAPSEHGHPRAAAVGMHPTVVRVFIDKVDWDRFARSAPRAVLRADHEVGVAADGNRVFPSVKALREHAGHDLIECGIVEVEMRLVRVIEPGTI